MLRLRTVLDLPSSISLLSFETHGSDDLSSTHSGIISAATSTSAAMGIGSTSGKVLLALGQHAIQCAEHIEFLVVSRKFPHRDDQRIRNIESTYHTLFELARPNIGYPTAIRRRALNLLRSQIISRQTKYLLQTLSKWPVVDVKIFLADIMEDQQANSNELALSILDLVVAAARQSTECCLLFLQAGMLNIVLYFYLVGDLNPNLRGAARKAYFDLAEVRLPDDQCGLGLASYHPILSLVAPRSVKHHHYSSELAARGHAWRVTHPAMVHHRFSMISSAVRAGRWVPWGSEWIVDLAEFMDSHFGNEIPFLAFDTLLTVIQQRELLVEHVLTEHFKETPKTRDTVLQSLVQMCTSLFQEPIIIPLVLDRHRLRQIVICYFVPLFCAITQTDDTCLDSFMNAGVAELLWAIALLQDTSYLHFKEGNLDIDSRHYEAMCRDIMKEATRIFMPDTSDTLLLYMSRSHSADEALGHR
ncbi:hypothetical protein BDN71DRAFT_1586277 [Pleurotus eryngii]|uniref:Uncharacterized protein n=1 Tax=Pleurotus eryngii TaxID=5323 RepID=A0A9P6A4Z6_PLEER|nr:hypothetical protein BDN71DRAFT_1586277 [Pleurotus eryngii]